MAKQTYKKHLNKKPNKDQTFEKKDDVKIEAITYEEGITVGDLADKLNKNSGEIIKILFMLGKMVTINSALDDENVDKMALKEPHLALFISDKDGVEIYVKLFEKLNNMNFNKKRLYKARYLQTNSR